MGSPYCKIFNDNIKIILMYYLDIQICNVRGVAATGAGGLGPTAPEVLSRHYMAHHLRTFHCDRPKHKGPVDKDNEFKVTN